MRGSIRSKADNRWELRVYAGVDVTTGTKRWVSRTVRGSRAEAELELSVLGEQIDYPRRRALDTTVEDLLTTWYQVASGQWAPNTRRHTRSVIDHHLIPRFGHLPVGKLTTADIDDFYAELVTHGRGDNRPLTDGTVARIHGVLRRSLNQAVRWEWIWDNPAIHATPPRVDQREIVSPAPEAVARLLTVAERVPGLAAYLRVAATTGARRGQIVALRWSDLNLTHGWISYCRSISEEVGGALVVVPTKTRRRNRVELDPATTARLAAHRRTVEERAAAAGMQLKGDAYVFSHDPDGARPWRPDYVSKQFRRLRAESGLEGHRLHDLRHFMATEMINAGVPIPIVAARLAHSRSSTTINVYAHAVPGGDRGAAVGLAARLDIPPHGKPG
jgi:integrase